MGPAGSVGTEALTDLHVIWQVTPLRVSHGCLHSPHQEYPYLVGGVE